MTTTNSKKKANRLALGLVGIKGEGLIGGTLVSVVGACILIWLGRKLSK